MLCITYEFGVLVPVVHWEKFWGLRPLDSDGAGWIMIRVGDPEEKSARRIHREKVRCLYMEETFLPEGRSYSNIYARSFCDDACSER